METPNFATPTNTTGMGNPSAPGENGEVGSGDTFVANQTSKKRKMKSLKDYLKKKK
jgi:hypothetical protein